MRTALFVARLQPLHKGHMHAIKNALRKYRLVILVGSTNRHDRNNPFSFAVRKKMVNAALSNYAKRYRIIGVPDYRSDAQWTAEVMRKARFDLVLSGSAWVRRCLSAFPAETPEMLKRREYNATRIRRLMRQGKKWRRLVPKEVAEIILQSAATRSSGKRS